MALLTKDAVKTRSSLTPRTWPAALPDTSPCSFPSLWCLLSQLIHLVQWFSGVSNSGSPKLEINKRCLKLDCLTIFQLSSEWYLFRVINWSFLVICLLIVFIIGPLGISNCQIHRWVMNTWNSTTVHVQWFSIFAENRRVAGGPALSHIPRVAGFATLVRDVGAVHLSQAQYQWTLLLGSEF